MTTIAFTITPASPREAKLMWKLGEEESKELYLHIDTVLATNRPICLASLEELGKLLTSSLDKLLGAKKLRVSYESGIFRIIRLNAPKQKLTKIALVIDDNSIWPSLGFVDDGPKELREDNPSFDAATAPTFVRVRVAAPGEGVAALR